MKNKWVAITALLGFQEGVHFEHNPDGSINLHEDHMDTINAKLVADATALEGVTALQATITDLQTNATNHANELLAANKKVEDAQASITDLQSQIEAKETELTTAKNDLATANGIIAGRPQGQNPFLGGGGSSKTFADKVKTYDHNKLIDDLI